MSAMSYLNKTDVNLLLIDNQEQLLSSSLLLPELRKQFLNEQVCCLAAPDSLCGLQLWRAFEMDVVVIAACEAGPLRTMIMDLEGEHPGVVVLVAGEEHDRPGVLPVLRETGSRFIPMYSNGDTSPVGEITRQVRQLRTEKLKIARSLALEAQQVGPRYILRLRAPQSCH
ncbi:hypothetical protein Despr_0119 [Desulfobulbus propionicus DSM 2032]|uniref:Response regulatory domain-containing protein n=1 Tax=Desulfobulbus propionicus (strain ATCC 33891 / DSM 2032 / VKM B-1956 / 1pr3) TaxID=577650 RepID=A0A7U3YJ26_DESPD|nr:hypothetical protein [Desulfobulbus propionicus]ADW16310.1 hypothetical protein Despr_0119 [Desulfobulbus propionicus DSM 2032]